MRRERRNKYPQVLAEIAVEVTKMRKDLGDDEKTAMAFGFEVAEAIRRGWGGMQIYIPRANSFFLSKRDEEILQDFNGSNHAEVCSKYGICGRQLYKILGAQRANGGHRG